MSVWSRLTEPKMQIPQERKLFDDASLRKLILPLFGEQLLVMLVGIADTLMISYAGEAAVSGVSLVNMIVTFFMYLFSAVSSGGAVVVSQYIGRRDSENGGLAAGQITGFCAVFSLVVTALVLAFNERLIGFLYSQVTPEVTAAAVTYLRINAYSFPALALYMAGAALLRTMGRTRDTMVVSMLMNGINIAGNAIGIFVLRAGVAGVAWPTFISRVFAACAALALCFRAKDAVRLSLSDIFRFDRPMLRRVFAIAVPNGVENGLFQLSKVVLGTITALFGVSQIAANGVAQSIWSMAALVSIAMQPAFLTIIGQCMGAGDTDAADYYMRKLLRASLVISILWNALVLLLTPPLLALSNLTMETRQLVWTLVLIHNIFCGLVSPFFGPFASGLRAAGDARFTMWAALFATVVCRVFLSFAFGVWMNLGVIGIAWAMVCDWVIKSVILGVRYKSGKWKAQRVID